MRILLVSDTHGNNEALDILKVMYPKMDLYLHAGDSESDAFSIEPFRAVKGNCDYFGDFLNYIVIPTPYGNLFMQHKPIPNSQLMKEYNVKIFVCGHTHQRQYFEENGIVYINPGAIAFARDKYYYSYAILDIDEKNVKVEFHTLDEDIPKKKTI